MQKFKLVFVVILTSVCLPTFAKGTSKRIPAADESGKYSFSVVKTEHFEGSEDHFSTYVASCDSGVQAMIKNAPTCISFEFAPKISSAIADGLNQNLKSIANKKCYYELLMTSHLSDSADASGNSVSKVLLVCDGKN